MAVDEQAPNPIVTLFFHAHGDLCQAEDLIDGGYEFTADQALHALRALRRDVMGRITHDTRPKLMRAAERAGATEAQIAQALAEIPSEKEAPER
jgi:hypothetical protein